jgi:hypothetical protein
VGSTAAGTTAGTTAAGSLASSALPEIVVTGVNSALTVPQALALGGAAAGGATLANGSHAVNNSWQNTADPAGEFASAQPGVGNAGRLAASGSIGGGSGAGAGTGTIGNLAGTAGAKTGANMAWTDWIGPALSAGASIIGSRQANNATSAGEQRAIAEQQRQFDLVRSDTAPQRQLGADAIARLSRLYGYGGPGQITATAPGTNPNLSSAGARIAGRVLGTPPTTYDNATGAPVASGGGSPDMSAFFESPDYQFNLAEGQKAIDRSLVARSGALSGAGAKEGVRFASGSASREYGSFVDRLMQQAGLGSNGTAQSAAAGANAANNIGAAAINAGNTRASIYGQNAANISNAVQGGISNSILQRYLGQGG